MAKIQEAHNRLFKNVFVCRKCGAKIKASPRKVLERKIKCRKCGNKSLRPKKRK